MAWVRTDDSAPDHPKFLALHDDAAIALWWRALCYCNHNRNGGFVAAGALHKLSLAARPSALAAKLVKVGLWEATEGGFQFHDYVHYQGTREQVEEARRPVSPARQEAGRRGGQRSGEARRAKLGRSPDEAPTKPRRSQLEAQTKPDEASSKPARSQLEAPGSSRASDSGSDPLPGSQSDPELSHSARAGEAEQIDRDAESAEGSPPSSRPAALGRTVELDSARPAQDDLLRFLGDLAQIGHPWARKVHAGLGEQGWTLAPGQRETLVKIRAERTADAARPPGAHHPRGSTLQQPAPAGAPTWSVGQEI